MKPQQRLPRAAEFADFFEDQFDRRLDASVRILLQTIPGLYEAHGCIDDEFTASRLLVAGGEGALPKQIKFIFIQASLEPEQEAIIAEPGRIDCLLIDEQRIDDAAHLNQLLPITAVAREARHLARGDHANLAEADFGDHPLKSGARHATCPPPNASRSSSIVSISEKPSAVRRSRMAYCKFRLSRIVQDLMRRRLAHVEDRLAREVDACRSCQSFVMARLPARQATLARR